MTEPVKNEEALVVKVTETVSTMALLNLYWLVSSLLIVPIFSATEALFYCVNQHVTDRKTGFFKEYFGYVKANMITSMKRQSVPFLILLIVIVDTVVIFMMPAESLLKSLGIGMFSVLSVLVYFIFMYQLAYLFFKNRKDLLKKRVLAALYTVLRYPQYTVGMILVLIVYVLLSLYFVPMLIFFGLSFPAYCFTFVLINKVSQKSHRM